MSCDTSDGIVTTTTPPRSGISSATFGSRSVPGWQIQEEIIQRSPLRVGDELSEGTDLHRATPRERILLGVGVPEHWGSVFRQE